MPMTLLDLKDAIASAIADAIGHGMREKCDRHADAVMVVVGPQLLAAAEHVQRIEADERAVPVNADDAFNTFRLAYYGSNKSLAPELESFRRAYRAIATQPHSPDAADSGRVSESELQQLEYDVGQGKYTAPWVFTRMKQYIGAALAAQGQGEANLAGYVDPEQVADMQRNGGGVSIGSFSERYGRTVPVYFHSAPPASPAGVPEGNAKWIAKAVPLLKAAVSWMPTKKCAAHIREIDALLRAAPSAPEGNGGGE